MQSYEATDRRDIPGLSWGIINLTGNHQMQRRRRPIKLCSHSVESQDVVYIAFGRSCRSRWSGHAPRNPNHGGLTGCWASLLNANSILGRIAVINKTYCTYYGGGASNNRQTLQ